MPLRSPAAKPALPEDLKGAVQALSDGTLAARAYCESRLARIRANEAGLRAWIALDDERALTLAAARDAERVRGGHLGALHGVPVGVKDVFDTDDLPTEMGSPAFVGNQPGKNAAGRITEPLVCVPTATGTWPAATEAAEPEEEPPGVCLPFQGLRVSAGCMKANSVVAVLPSA